VVVGVLDALGLAALAGPLPQPRLKTVLPGDDGFGQRPALGLNGLTRFSVEVRHGCRLQPACVGPSQDSARNPARISSKSFAEPENAPERWRAAGSNRPASLVKPFRSPSGSFARKDSLSLLLIPEYALSEYVVTNGTMKGEIPSEYRARRKACSRSPASSLVPSMPISTLQRLRNTSITW
jgi:hypothetical protein